MVGGIRTDYDGLYYPNARDSLRPQLQGVIATETVRGLPRSVAATIVSSIEKPKTVANPYQRVNQGAR